MSIFIGLVFVGPWGSGEGDFDRDGSALACLANDGEFATEQSGPFAHAQEPD
jgi:hypothetical protein